MRNSENTPFLAREIKKRSLIRNGYAVQVPIAYGNGMQAKWSGGDISVLMCHIERRDTSNQFIAECECSFVASPLEREERVS